METLSIIAYKQPVTRNDVEEVRSVDASYAVRSLLDKGLIRIQGRKEVPGRPLLYGTSKRFLEVFGFKTLGDKSSKFPLRDTLKSRILVKVGTNVLTRANGRLNYNIISDLVEQIVALQKDHEVILVSSGAAGAGREFFDFKDVKDPLIKKQMLCSVGQARLFQVYADLLREQSVLPAQALISRTDFSND